MVIRLQTRMSPGPGSKERSIKTLSVFFPKKSTYAFAEGFQTSVINLCGQKYLIFVMFNPSKREGGSPALSGKTKQNRPRRILSLDSAPLTQGDHVDLLVVPYVFIFPRTCQTFNPTKRNRNTQESWEFIARTSIPVLAL